MPATNQDFQISAGRSYRIDIPVTDGAGRFPDLTNATAKFSIGRGSRPDSGQRLTKTTGGAGVTITGTAPGQFTLHAALAPADTSGIPPGSYYYEAAVTDQAGTYGTVSSGLIQVEASLIP